MHSSWLFKNTSFSARPFSPCSGPLPGTWMSMSRCENTSAWMAGFLRQSAPRSLKASVLMLIMPSCDSVPPRSRLTGISSSSMSSSITPDWYSSITLIWCGSVTAPSMRQMRVKCTRIWRMRSSSLLSSCRSCNSARRSVSFCSISSNIVIELSVTRMRARHVFSKMVCASENSWSMRFSAANVILVYWYLARSSRMCTMRSRLSMSVRLNRLLRYCITCDVPTSFWTASAMTIASSCMIAGPEKIAVTDDSAVRPSVPPVSRMAVIFLKSCSSSFRRTLVRKFTKYLSTVKPSNLAFTTALFSELFLYRSLARQLSASDGSWSWMARSIVPSMRLMSDCSRFSMSSLLV
eukprot:Unigene2246_Nuclearia_a/m.6981 Unigene2246_Nuclearia_a/g.6981  ORF Unigene2246_Nuclearia_a/g.6981 Unigene2246_Nuclearia_a/m.6981 type:complete len:350 (+) Unigene2246_Nuclearia_a:365-1414(+)